MVRRWMFRRCTGGPYADVLIVGAGPFSGGIGRRIRRPGTRYRRFVLAKCGEAARLTETARETLSVGLTPDV